MALAESPMSRYARDIRPPSHHLRPLLPRFLTLVYDVLRDRFLLLSRDFDIARLEHAIMIRIAVRAKSDENGTRVERRELLQRRSPLFTRHFRHRFRYHFRYRRDLDVATALTSRFATENHVSLLPRFLSRRVRKIADQTARSRANRCHLTASSALRVFSRWRHRSDFRRAPRRFGALQLAFEHTFRTR